MDKDVAIIVQGPITQMEYDFIRDKWGSHQLIISTWEGNVTQFKDGDIIIYNKIPNDKGVHNFNLQKVSTHSGLLKAREMGYQLALKIRNDMYPTYPQALLDSMDWDKLNLLAWHEHKDGYITDYIMAGNINDLLRLYDVKPDGAYPEYILTEKLFNSKLSNKTNYFLDKLNTDNNIHWHHKGEFKRLSDYKAIEQYTTKQPDIWN